MATPEMLVLDAMVSFCFLLILCILEHVTKTKIASIALQQLFPTH